MSNILWAISKTAGSMSNILWAVPKTAGSMSNILDDPQHWRARADEMRQLANLASDITAKETILRIAYDYAQLAWYAEDRLKKDKNSN
jgi:hypothetical protein